MKSRFTHLSSHVVLTSIITIAVSVGCSASRSAGSPAQVTDSPTISQSSSPIVGSSAQEKTPCTLNMSQAPTIKGLKLGMTPDEVLALFPGSKDDSEVRSELARPANLGASSLFIKPSKYGGDKFTDIVQVTAKFLDGKVSNLMVGYNGPEWPHVNKFVAKFIEGTSLPAVDQWEAYVGLDNQLKILSCTDFEVRVFAGGPGGNLNYVQMQDREADKKLKERRKKAREQASPTPGNQ
jgi:hypothetical protein